MEFSEQIKTLGKENHLPQEQFAQKINVTGQAVSSWENNRNLPDIETLIGCFLMIMEMVCILIRAKSVEYIDKQGILHENFYLLPVGFFLMSAGLIVILTMFCAYLVRRFRKKRIASE